MAAAPTSAPAPSTSAPSAGTPGAVLITGTTSGVGLNAVKALVDRGWTVVTANRDPVRAAAAAESLGIPTDKLHHIRMDLGDLESVRVGVETLVGSLGFGLDALVINAAVYKPRLKQPERSPQGYELSMATNHLGHFLLIQLLLPDVQRSPAATETRASPGPGCGAAGPHPRRGRRSGPGVSGSGACA